ncbi:Cocaine esterase [Homalodisca vitripennis]|nr:Cocaine esterase [Homalodisca vitripennis]
MDPDQNRSPLSQQSAGRKPKIRPQKKSPNPYLNFTKVFLTNYGGEKKTQVERMKEAAGRWRQMGDQERRPYIEMAAAAKRRRRREKSQVNVTTSKGEIIGVRVNPNPATGVSYDAFLGVPYGKVQGRFQTSHSSQPLELFASNSIYQPLGGLSPWELMTIPVFITSNHKTALNIRFHFPQFLAFTKFCQPLHFGNVQPDSWSQPLITQEDGAMCPQPNEKYSENCLFLNVFTPMNASQNAAASLPVMAFIHGSAFTVSSSSSRLYGPDFLIPKGVILVAMNYRLGAAGFLTLGTKIAPGNLGLTDTLLALQWIQREIHHFGGNCSSVTLMGQSAGSAMTQFHYLSSQSTGVPESLVQYCKLQAGPDPGRGRGACDPGAELGGAPRRAPNDGMRPP